MNLCLYLTYSNRKSGYACRSQTHKYAYMNACKMNDWLLKIALRIMHKYLYVSRLIESSSLYVINKLTVNIDDTQWSVYVICSLNRSVIPASNSCLPSYSFIYHERCGLYTAITMSRALRLKSFKTAGLH